MDKWARFKQYMNGYATSEEQGLAVIEGARATFSFFYEWLSNNVSENVEKILQKEAPSPCLITSLLIS